MLKKNQGVFLQTPGSHVARVLHPALICDVENRVVTVRCDDDYSIQPGELTFLYFERHRKFVRVPMRVDAQLQREPRSIVVLEQRGKVESADRRQHPRFCTVGADLFARFGKEEQCPVHDVSASGLSLSATCDFQIGTMVPVTIAFAGEDFGGRVSVQSVRTTDDGVTRYGLHSAQDPDSAPLRAGLRFICQTIERRQLSALRNAG